MQIVGRAAHREIEDADGMRAIHLEDGAQARRREREAAPGGQEGGANWEPRWRALRPVNLVIHVVC